MGLGRTCRDQSLDPQGPDFWQQQRCKGETLNRKSIYRSVAAGVRPALRFPFPGRWRVFAYLINKPNWARYWTNAPLRWTRCKNSGFLIPCDLSVFSGRIAWYFRRWYEIDTQSAIQTLLPAGGTFVDIGANCGMASLSAAAAIGPEGRVIAFEPNPEIAAVYSETMRRNGLNSIVTLHNAAIAATDGRMDLFIPSSNHGEASLATDFDGRDGRTISVRVSSGTELDQLDRIDLVKIDVEGFEKTVLEVISPALKAFSPVVITEMMDDHLSRAGTSSVELRHLMESLGYKGFMMMKAPVGPLHQRAQIAPLPVQQGFSDGNVLWVPAKASDEADSIEFRRLKK